MDNSIALELLQHILKYKSGDVVDSMFKRGIIYKINYGVPVQSIKKLSEEFAGNHELAEALYAMDYREAKLAAIFIEDKESLTPEQMDRWALDFINNEIVEQAVNSLFWKSKYALFKASEWALSSNEYLQKAGLMIIGKLASADNSIKDAIFEPYIEIIDSLHETPSAHARSAAAFALREIGRRNKNLNQKALALTDKMSHSDNFSAKWIVEEVSWILKDEELQKKLA